MPTTIDLESQRMLLGTVPVRKIYQGTTLLGARIADLFASGEQGVWYDPSDLSTLFQDTDGTIPVTGVEQPVGLMLDKSGRGNHASQATTTARPVVSARYNLLQDTMFQDATTTRKWENLGLSVTPTYGTHAAPDGTMTAVTLTTTGGAPTCYQPFTVIALPFVVSFYARLGGAKPTTSLVVRNATTSTNVSSGGFNNSTGAVSGVGWSHTDVGGGWYRVQTTLSTGFSVGDTAVFYLGFTGAHSAAGESCIVWGPDVRLSVDTLNLPAYQRVTSATDYDTIGFPVYLKPDGVDDFMQTVQNVNLSGTAKMSAVIGLTKLTDALRAIVYEHGTTFGLLGNFGFEAPGANANPHFSAAYNGGSGAAAIVRTGISAPATLVGTLQNYLDTPWRNLAVNKLVPVTNTVDNGAGPFASAIAYLFARTGTGHRFAGRFYGMLIVGRACSEAEMNSMRQFLRNKSRAY